MPWTSRNEAAPCCAGEFGAVSSDEHVVRLRLKQYPQKGYSPFQRTDFFRTSPPFNDCGQQEGCSVDRLLDLSDPQVRARSEAKAALSNQRSIDAGREPLMSGDGGLVACVADLRLVRREGAPAEQIIFVYDDARDDNPQHAVIRAADSVPDEERRSIIRKVELKFTGSVDGSD